MSQIQEQYEPETDSRIQHSLLPFTFDSSDDHGDFVETFYNVRFTDDFGVFKK